MRVIYLPTFWTILVDFAAWFMIHLGVAFALVRFSVNRFNPGSWLFKSRNWERGGEVYPRFFKIRKWKARLPDASPFLRGRGFPKKRLAERSDAYFTAFVHETCRAEATHWIMVLFAPFFFLWNPVWVGFFMIFYALAENIPLIMAQRYNRYRLRRVLGEEGTPEVRAING